MRERSAAKLLLWGAAGVAAAGAAVLLYFVDPAESAWLPGCPLRTLTGLNCAGCGGTRGIHALLHGDVAGCFRMNALLLPLLALAGLLQLLTASQGRLARTMEKWRETHMLIQAAEYCLLQKGEDPGSVPVDFFPYDGYTANCTFRDAENLPETYTNIVGQIPLKACEIELVRQRDGKTVDSIIVDKFSYESTVQGE